MKEQSKIPIPKTQKEISLSQQKPYDKTRGNPNSAVFDPNNRGNQVSFRDDDTKPFSIGLEDLDYAVDYYIKKVVKPYVYQNGEKVSVPLMYGTPEKWVQIQKEGYYRDSNGKIQLPLITFKRNNIERNRSITNKLDSNFPYNIQVFTKTYSKKDAYSKFNILNNRVPKEDYYAVVVPNYVTISYNFIIHTYYMEQMNKIIEAIDYASDSYWGDPEKFKFRAYINNYSTPIEYNAGKERVVKTNFELKLYGYVIPDVTQKDISSIKKFSNKNQLIFKTEVVDSIE